MSGMPRTHRCGRVTLSEMPGVAVELARFLVSVNTAIVGLSARRNGRPYGANDSFDAIRSLPFWK